MDRRKNRDVLFSAFQCAIMDRQAMADGCARGSVEREDALADIRAFRRLSRTLLGTDRSKLDAELERGVCLPVDEIRRRMDEADKPDS